MPDADLRDYDPLDPAVIADPFPYYRKLQRDSPVHEVDKHGFFVISRYDDVVSVLQNWQEILKTAFQQGVAKGKESEDVATRNVTLNREGPTYRSQVTPNDGDDITVERPGSSSSHGHGVKVQVGAKKYANNS